jgi:hypothetical protein
MAGAARAEILSQESALLIGQATYHARARGYPEERREASGYSGAAMN